MRTLSRFLSNLLRILWTYRVVTFSLLVMYAAVWHADQGIDLLANLNANKVGPGIFIAIVSVVAALYWHLPKFIYKSSQGESVSWQDVFFGYYQYKMQVQNTSRYEQESGVARLLGVLTFLIPACAILNALKKFEVSFMSDFVDPHVWLGLGAVFFSWLFNNNLIDRWYQSSSLGRKVLHAIMIGAPLAVMFLGVFNEGYPSDLALLSTDFFLMAVAFAIFVSIRRHVGLTRLSWMEMLQQVNIAPYVMLSACMLVFVFILMNVFPLFLATSPYNVFAQVSNLSILSCALVFYTLFFALLMFWGKRIKVTVAGFFILFSVIVAASFENDFHDVRLMSRESPVPELQDYFHNWINARTSEINEYTADKRYPVFVVNTYGGGIRAAAWTSLAIQNLDSLTKRIPEDKDFQHHTIAYSGASGGTIGASVMCAYRSTGKESMSAGQLKKFYNQDFLSPVLTGMVGRDVLFSAVNHFSPNDRAVLQEEIWADHLKKKLGGDYLQSIAKLWGNDTQYEVPLLVSNTYHIEEGFKGIAVAAHLNASDFPSVTCVEELMPKDKDLRLSTAAFLSARFPFISPAGKMDDTHHFMDGGLKENSGGHTAAQLITVLQRVIGQLPDSLSSKLEIHLLSLDNGLAADPIESEASNLFELLAPLKALYSNWVGNTKAADLLNREQLGSRYHKIKITKEKIDDRYTPVYPLGWQMSAASLRAMEQSLQRESNQKVMNELVQLINR